MPRRTFASLLDSRFTFADCFIEVRFEKLYDFQGLSPEDFFSLLKTELHMYIKSTAIESLINDKFEISGYLVDAQLNTKDIQNIIAFFLEVLNRPLEVSFYPSTEGQVSFWSSWNPDGTGLYARHDSRAKPTKFWMK